MIERFFFDIEGIALACSYITRCHSGDIYEYPANDFNNTLLLRHEFGQGSAFRLGIQSLNISESTHFQLHPAYLRAAAATVSTACRFVAAWRIN